MQKPVTATRWAWLTPGVCRASFAGLLVFGIVGHIRYLVNDCPLGLSGDEAQYWDWSRQLGLSYYSKGPLVAYIIRASCALMGEDSMLAVRLPAMVLAIGTSLLTYWLIVKLFRSDRLALGAALLSHCVPVFIVGSILMTIDPPYYFCWAAATCLAVIAIFDDKKWAWPLIGVVLGVGFLAKYAMFLWLIGLAIFLWIDRPSRKHFRTPWPWIAVAIALLFTIPVIIWNSQHGWVSAAHVKTQTGTGFKIGNPFEFLATQIGILGLGLFFVVVGSVAYIFRDEGKADPNRRALIYLATIGLSFFVICGLTSFRTKIQANWPAPMFFTLMILATYFLSLRLGRGAPHKWWWRGNVIATVICGLIFLPVAHDFSLVYRFLPLINSVTSFFGAKNPKTARSIDPTYKLRGGEFIGAFVGTELRKLPAGSFVTSDDYQQVSLLAFYLPGQPKTYYCGSYYSVRPSRYTQYDMWPDRALEPDKTALLGKDAIHVGGMHPELRASFASVERLPDQHLKVRGEYLRGYETWVCRGFKGLQRGNNTRR